MPTAFRDMRRQMDRPEDATLRLDGSTVKETTMGKYLFAWILGVPAIVLVGIYAVTHLL
ncbi:MAG: hypothetical protein ABI724_11850 [Betaproteobacteria bacterium]